MKKLSCLIVLFCIALVRGLPFSEGGEGEGRLDSISSKILELVEKLREQMKEGAPEMGIPPLDPLYVQKLDLSKTQVANLVKLDVATFEKITVQGLPKFVVDHVKANILNLRLELNLTFPEVIVTGYYDVDGLVMDLIPIYGSGPFYVGLFDLKVGGRALLGSQDGKLFLETLDLRPSLGHLNVLLDGLMGGGDLGVQLNGILQTVGGDVLNKHLPSLSGIISDFARTKINDALRHIDFSSVIG